MEFVSLEDEGNELFITQESVENSQKNPRSVGILPDPNDFTSPVSSIIPRGNQPYYSDISDEEDFQIPCSQKNLTPSFELVLE